MTDNEKNSETAMSDDEIIKALKICTSSSNGCSHSNYTCDDCYLKGQPMCSAVLHQDTIDLINRLQADKEALIAGQETLQKALAEKNTEIERLQSDYSSMQSTLAKMSMGVEQSKAEAIKECLNKVAVFCAESGLFQCEADEMLLLNYLDSLKMEAMLKANGMVGDTE